MKKEKVYILLDPKGQIIEVFSEMNDALQTYNPGGWAEIPALDAWAGMGDFTGYRVEEHKVS